jgi:hypothetical protein
MKILWLYQFSSYYNYDKWFHLELVRWMKNNGYEITAYGPGLEIEYPDLVDIPFQPSLSWDSIVKRTKSTVAVFNTKSRMFANYNPHTNIAEGCWLPPGWNTSNIVPKVMIEEDYHYEKNDDWYFENNFSLILQRHYSQSLRVGKVPVKWHPFSVDTSIFNPGNINPRTNKICFAGSMTHPYPERILACSILSSKNYIDVFKSQEKKHTAYIDCLKQYVAHLSGSSMYDISAAKNFEIAASGSLLFTNKFSGLDLLFDNNSYCEFSSTGVDILEKANKILKDPAYVAFTKENALKNVIERHTNQIRTQELIKILDNL